MKKISGAPNNIDQYIAGFPEDIQKSLEEIRKAIRQAAPAAEEKISYQMPAFFLNGNLVYFAAWKKHIGFYPGTAAIKEFEHELSAYAGAKGSVQFPLDRPMPLDLIQKIVTFRVDVNLRKRI